MFKDFAITAQQKLNQLKVLWRVNHLNKLSITLMLLVTLTTGVFLTQQVTGIFSRAAGETVSIYFDQSSAALPPNHTFRIMVDAKTNHIVFSRVVIQFNPAKIRLNGNINAGISLGRVVEMTDSVTANTTGKAVIVLGAAPNSVLPSGLFTVADFNLTSVSSQPNDLSTLDFVSTDMEITEKSEVDLPFSVQSSQLVLNPVSPTLTPVPSATPYPTLTPTPRPTGAPIPTQTPTPIPTRIPTPTITPTPGTGIQTLIFTPSDDSTVYANDRYANDGRSSTIRVDNSPVNHMLLKFNVSGVGARKVISAKLRLYNTQESVFGGSFYQTSSDWNQSSVTWNNAPPASGYITSLGRVSMRRWYVANMTSYITGDGTYSIRAESNTSDGADYASRESSHPPQLILTVGY